MIKSQVEGGIELKGNAKELGEAIYQILTGKEVKGVNE